MSEILSPTVHLNGTPGNQLVEQLENVRRALQAALKALEEASPNGRDYYPQGQEAISRASAQHRQRAEKLSSVLREIYSMAEAVQDQIDEREAQE